MNLLKPGTGNGASIKKRKKNTKEALNRKSEKIIKEYFDDNLIVRAGPFSGMRYCGPAHGSAFFPKLLGSYEYPLHDVVNSELTRPLLRKVVNVGCAEGYYAVGAAIRRKDISVTAYDESDAARKACKHLASANSIGERLTVKERCSAEELAKVTGRDIEGAEIELIDPQLVPALISTTIILEVHDFLRRGATDIMIERFRRSHHIQLIIDDYYVERWDALRLSEEFQHVDEQTKTRLLDEKRPPAMRWLHMAPKHAA